MNVKHLLKHHPSFAHAGDLQDLIKPLKQLGISYFGHAHVDAQGMVSGHATCPEYLAHYYEQGYHHNDLHLARPELGQSYVLWDIVPQYGKTAELYHEVSLSYDVYHTFTLIQATQDYVDYYHFGTTPDKEHMNQFYLQHVDLLEKFIEFYKSLLFNDRILKQSFDFAFRPDEVFGGYQEVDAPQTQLSPEQRQAFLQSLQDQSVAQKVINRAFDAKEAGQTQMLSARELQCLGLLAHGRTAKAIGRALDIQPKTVYYYLDNVKKKVAAYSKHDLVNYYWQHCSNNHIKN